MNFYTNVLQWGNNLLIRAVINDKREKFRERYSPTLYAPVEKQTPYKNLDGGYLEIAPDQNIRKGRPLDTYTINHHTERYMPLENRLIIFNPSRLHRVSKIHKGIRKAFLANAWTKKPSTFDKGENINVSVNGSFEFVDWKEKNQAFNI